MLFRSGLKCTCGSTIRTGEIPNPNEWLMISDTDYDMCSGSIDSEALYEKMSSMLVCIKCQRLWIYWKGWGQAPVSYKIDAPPN